MMFIAHEYFHNYNVKLIRPYELGPFDYDRGSRTNLLWFSEGATVYYEYLLVRRAGLIVSESTDLQTGRKQLSISKSGVMNPEQSAIFRSWTGN